MRKSIVFFLLVFLFSCSVSFATSRVFYENFDDGNANEFSSHTASVVVTSPYSGSYCGRANWVSAQNTSEFRQASWSYTTETFIRYWIRTDSNCNDYSEPAGCKFMRLSYFGGGNTDTANAINISTGGIHWTWYCAGIQIINEYVGILGLTTWTKVEVYIKDADSEGEIKLWINDVLLEQNEVPFTGDTHDTDENWDDINLPSNWVGRGPDPNYVYYDDVEIYSDAGSDSVTGSMANGDIAISTGDSSSVTFEGMTPTGMEYP